MGGGEPGNFLSKHMVRYGGGGGGILFQQYMLPNQVWVFE